MAEALLELANPNRAAVHPDVIVTIPHSTITGGRVNPFDPPTVIDAGGKRHVAVVSRSKSRAQRCVSVGA